MEKVIKVKLDPRSIADAIKKIEEYKADLEKRVRFLLETMVGRGEIIAKAKVVEYKIIHDNDLTKSIRGFVQGNVGYLHVDDEHAVFFELGTGPVGASDPHPLHPSYSADGWFTRADDKPMDKLYGWTPLESGNGYVYYHTYGQKSKPFMYETALKLREEFPAIVKEVFG